jgi:glycosyltransferase involved in cell wall biosynthesis
MRLALLTTDDRELRKRYDLDHPIIPTPQEALLQGLAKLNQLEVHLVSCLQQPVHSPPKLADNIWFHSLHVPKIGWLRTLYQGCIRATRRKLRELRPDIVHGQGTERECAMNAVFSGFPNVLTIHGNMVAMAEFYGSRIGSFHWLAARLETLVLRRAGGVLCNSAYTERLVAPRANRIWRVPNPLRSAFFAGPLILARAPQPILLNVGVLSPYKRQIEILNVARNLWKRGLRFEMQFAGAIDRRNRYSTQFLCQLAEAEAAGYARHRGTLGINELVAALDSASALVHFSSEESFGLVVAEALARNLKLFAAGVGGVVDIASGVEGAELFAAEDWTGLEQAVARWIQSGHPRPSAAAAVMRERYHPDIVARQHLEIYQKVLNNLP